MKSHGNHTWNLYLHYYSCPQCGFIIESRQDYEERLTTFEKELTCPRCQHNFTLTKKPRPTFGPLTGEPQPVEFDWS